MYKINLRIMIAVSENNISVLQTMRILDWHIND